MLLVYLHKIMHSSLTISYYSIVLNYHAAVGNIPIVAVVAEVAEKIAPCVVNIVTHKGVV